VWSTLTMARLRSSSCLTTDWTGLLSDTISVLPF
jgi:hypothetical protein